MVLDLLISTALKGKCSNVVSFLKIRVQRLLNTCSKRLESELESFRVTLVPLQVLCPCISTV